MKCLLLIMFFTVVSAQALDLSPLFSDHMVLQQQTAVPVWGTAEPGTAVVVKSEWGETAETRADQDGHWFVELETVQADGPFTLTISAFNDTIRIQDVMLGEVWLCSGQSNMEMPLAGWPPADTVRHSAREIRSADYPRIRMFMAARSVAMQPKNEISGSWKPCTPETAFAFSATAYFFALNLYQQLDVPIGLLHSSWGGTPVQAWMDAEALRETGEFLKVLDALQEGDEKIKAYNRWLEEKETIKVPNRDLDKFWAQLDFGQTVVADPEFDDSQCNTMELPQTWEDTEIGAFDGVVWFRRSIDIPKAWKDRELTLQLGPVDDMDATFFNGTEIGRLQQNGAWQVNRTYHVSAEQVKTGSNVIAVRVIDTGGGGGIYGEPKQMKLFPKDQPEIALPLSGDWAFLPTAEFRGNTFYLFDVNPPDFYSKPDLPFVVGPHTPSMLYNGMIAPLTPYRIKGAIWYQGESNTGNPDQYAQLFPQMIRTGGRTGESGIFRSILYRSPRMITGLRLNHSACVKRKCRR
ncbi:MAG: glycosyl hydrolase family 2 [candidate division KSB1 bacterium]|nr:glycosyl hydrolase family 2 [candidate division KSB1 bacterium]